MRLVRQLVLIGLGVVILAGVGLAANLSVDVNAVIQTNFIGAGANYQPFAYMPESNAKGYNDDIRNIEFSRVGNMGLPLAKSWYRPDWACGEAPGWPATTNWNSDKMVAFYNWLQAMKDRNVDVAITTGWGLGDVGNQWVVGNATYDSNTVSQWAAWMSESVNQIVTIRGFTNVKYLVLFVEPNGYGGTWDAFYQDGVALHNRLVSDGRRSLVKLTGPQSYNYDLWNCPAAMNDIIDVYTGHGYNLSGYDAWLSATRNLMSLAAGTGKPVWADEYGNIAIGESGRCDPSYGNYLAQAACGIINAGVQSAVMWELFDEQFPWPLDTADGFDCFHNGVHTYGTAPFLPNSQVPRPSFYALALMTKYLGGPGTSVYATTCDGGVCISATRQPGGDWTFLVVNQNGSASGISVNLSGPINKTLYRRLYDPATIAPTAAATMIGSDEVFAGVTTNFSDSIPASAVVIYSSIAPKLTFSPPAGVYYTTNQSVAISCDATGATIYYTTDGSTPNTSSAQYIAPVAIDTSKTISALAVVSGKTNIFGAATYTIQATMPSFSPPAGNYTSAQSVTISCGTTGATIYYTTDGSAPSSSALLYSGPIAVGNGMTIKAIAVKSGMDNSVINSAMYTIQAATPSFSLPAGDYISAQSVTVSCATPGATIYYTTDGSTPTSASTPCAGQVYISASITLKAIAVKSGLSDSAVATTVYSVLASYSHNMKITFAGYNKTEALTNFPALIVLGTNITGFAYSQFASPNGWDLRFSNSNQTTALNYEIENWNSNGNSFIWVQMPALSTSNDCIWAYWGSPAVTGQAAAYTTNGAAWDSHYRAVWHLNNGADDSQAYDSTANRRNASNMGAATNAAGVLAGAQGFNNTANSAFSVASGLGDLSVSGVTISTWVYLRNNVNYPMMLTYGSIGAMDFRFDGTTGQLESKDQVPLTSPTAIAGYQWRHVALTFDDPSDTIRLFIDGNKVAEGSSGNHMPSSGTAYIGRRSDNYYFDGLLDEMRLSDFARSANWMWAEYMTAASNGVFNSYGTVSVIAATATAHGIPYSWLASCGITNTADCVETNDPDGDGLNNLQEYIAGTNPTNRNSSFGVVITNVAGQIVVSLPSVQTNSYYPNVTRYYNIEQCTNLLNGGTWQPASGYSSIPASGGIIACTNMTPDLVKFYRAKVRLQ